MPTSVLTVVLPDCKLTEDQKKTTIERVEKVIRGEAVIAVPTGTKDPSVCVNAGPVSVCQSR